MEKSSDLDNAPTTPLALATMLAPCKTATLPSHEELKEQARFYALFADATRLAIIRLLVHGDKCVNEIVAATNTPASNISYHLRMLTDAGLVVAIQHGNTRTCKLTPNGIAATGIGHLMSMLMGPGAGET